MFDGSVPKQDGIRPMKLRTLALALCAAAITTGAFAKTKTVSLRDQQQAAARVRAHVHGVARSVRVTACMSDKKSVVSAKCAAMWDVK